MNKILCFIARRVVVYATVGGISGAISGAICLGLAGAFVGLISGWAVGEHHLEIMVSIASLGLKFGAGLSGGVGLFGFGVMGVVAPPTRELLPLKNAFVSMVKIMAFSTVTGVILYLLWSAILGLFRGGFLEATQEGALIAIFAIPALMGLGQIAAIWRWVSIAKTSGH